MAIKDWYKLTFLIESDSEEIIIWKLNELGIFSFSFEYLIKNENKKEVNIWLPIDDWNENSRTGFEKTISKLLDINASKNQFFAWSLIQTLADEGFTVFAVSIPQTALWIGISIIAGVIAAILPAIRASRQNILEAISYE